MVDEDKTAEVATVGPGGDGANPFENEETTDGGTGDSSQPGSEARAVITQALRELDAATTDASRARLHHGLGVLFERKLDDRRRAVHHYQEAYRLAPDQLASIRAARRIFWTRQNWTMVLALLDAELRLSSTPADAAAMQLDRAWLFEHWLANDERALTAYLAVLDRDPGNLQALGGLRRIYRRQGDRDGLLAVCRQAASVSRAHRARCELYGEIARLQQERGQEEAASESYAAAFVEDPANVRVTSALKQLYHRQGRFGDLVDVLLTEAEIATTAACQAQCFVAAARLCRDRLQQADRALDLLGRALRLLSGSGEQRGADGSLLAEMAELLRQLGRHAELAATYEALLEVLDDVGERVVAHHQLAQLLEQLDQQTEALWHYRHVVALDPTYVPALQALGRIYQRREMWGDLVAMRTAEAEALADPVERASHLCAAAELCEVRLGDPARAVEFHRRALDACPGHAVAERSLIRLLTRTGRWDQLLPLLEARLERLGRTDRPEASTNERPLAAEETASSVDRVRLQLEIARLCEEVLGDDARAIGHYEQALTARPQDPTLLQCLERLYQRHGRHADLLRVLDAEVALCEDPELAVTLAHQAAALCEQQLDRPDEALSRYERILSERPAHRPTLKALGQLLHRRGDRQRLLDLFRRELEIETSPQRTALLWYKCGELQEDHLQQPDQAIAAYREAASAAAGFLPALQALARLHRARGEWEALLGVMEQRAALLVDGPQRATVLHAIGDLWETRLQQPRRALQFFRQAFEIAPGHGPSRDALLRLLVTEGSAAEAVEVLELALRDGSTDEETRMPLLKHLAAVLEQRLHDPQRAMSCYEQLLALDADDSEALEALARLYRDAGRHRDLAQVHGRLAALAEDSAEAVYQLHEAAGLIEVHLQPQGDPAPIYERILELGASRDRRALEALVRTYEARGDSAALVRAYRRQLHDTREPAVRLDLLLRLAVACEQLGDIGTACRTLSEADELADDWLVVRELRRLEEKRQRFDAVAAALAREAALSSDRRLAVESLLRGVRLLREQFDDPERASEALVQVLELAPFHEEASTQLEQLLVQRSEWQRLVAVGFRRLEIVARDAEKVPVPQQIELLSRIAWIQREHLQQPAEAVQTLSRAARLDPNHLPTLLTLGELHVVREQWQEAIEIYSRVVALSDDPELLRKAHFQLGEVWSEPLADRREAISCFQNVLAVAPEDRAAMQRLYDLFVWCRDWENAADIVVRMIDSEVVPQRQIDLYIELAGIYERGFGDPQMAAEQLSNALAIDRLDDHVVGRLAELHARLGSWELVCEVLRDYLEALPAEQHPAGRSRRLQLADVLSRRLGQTSEALAVCHQALEIDPGDLETRLALARLLGQEGQIEQAVVEHRKVLAIDPLQLENLRQLRALWSRVGAYELAYSAAAVLVAFGAAGEIEQRVYRDYRARGVQMPSAALDAATYETHVARVEEPAAAWAVLSVLGEAAHRIRPPAFDRWQVGKADRLSPRSEDPLKVIVREVRAALGLPREVEVYVSPTSGHEMDLLLTDPPSLVVGAEVIGDFSSREVSFSVATLLAHIRHQCWIASGLDGRQLALLVHGACRLVDARHAVQIEDEHDVSDMARLIQRSLNRRSRRALEDACNRLTAAPLPDFDGWATAIEAMALRAGLWLVNDFEPAISQLRQRFPALVVEDDTDLEEVSAAVRQLPLAGELIRYWLSDDFVAARRAAAG